MDTQIMVVFCFCNDMLKSLDHREDRQRQMSDARVKGGEKKKHTKLQSSAGNWLHQGDYWVA